MNWHPAIEKTEGTGGNEAKAMRRVTLKSGGTTEDKLMKYSGEESTYAYEVTNVDVNVLPVDQLLFELSE